MIKSYTSLEQSKQLAEFLSLNSADMTYSAITTRVRDQMTIEGWAVTMGLNYAIRDNLFSYRNGYVLPCWSLAALLNVLPKSFFCEEGEMRFGIEKGDTFYEVFYETKYAFMQKQADNLVDACYEMILELHKQNIL